MPEYPVVGVDHPGPQHAQQHDEHDELVHRPQHVTYRQHSLKLNIVLLLTVKLIH